MIQKNENGLYEISAAERQVKCKPGDTAYQTVKSTSRMDQFIDLCSLDEEMDDDDDDDEFRCNLNDTLDKYMFNGRNNQNHIDRRIKSGNELDINDKYIVKKEQTSKQVDEFTQTALQSNLFTKNGQLDRRRHNYALYTIYKR